jgi:hypothetical protein
MGPLSFTAGCSWLGFALGGATAAKVCAWMNKNNSNKPTARKRFFFIVSPWIGSAVSESFYTPQNSISISKHANIRANIPRVEADFFACSWR